MEMDALFHSVGQALFFAYYMEAVPQGNKGATQILIEDLMERRYGLPEKTATINMGTLRPVELRAQCALIRKKVEALPTGERETIRARFGHGLTRKAAVEALGAYVEPLCVTRNASALLALIWSLYLPQARGRTRGVSLRRIEKEFGVNKSTLHRDQQRIREICTALEIRGQNTMDAQFIREGLIDDPAFASN